MPVIIAIFFMLILMAINKGGPSKLPKHKDEDDERDDDLYNTILIGKNGFITNTPSIEINTINPATGLPMIGGIAGVDVGGNIYGSSAHDLFSSSDLNPATGLPMIGGISGIDVGGHTYGSDY